MTGFPSWPGIYLFLQSGLMGARVQSLRVTSFVVHWLLSSSERTCGLLDSKVALVPGAQGCTWGCSSGLEEGWPQKGAADLLQRAAQKVPGPGEGRNGEMGQRTKVVSMVSLAVFI